MSFTNVAFVDSRSMMNGLARRATRSANAVSRQIGRHTLLPSLAKKCGFARDSLDCYGLISKLVSSADQTVLDHRVLLRAGRMADVDVDRLQSEQQSTSEIGWSVQR